MRGGRQIAVDADVPTAPDWVRQDARLVQVTDEPPHRRTGRLTGDMNLGIVENKHGAGSRPNDVFRDASHEQTIDTLSAVRPEDDEIAVVLPGQAVDLLDRVPLAEHIPDRHSGIRRSFSPKSVF